jgi:hypothetical protein
VSENDAKTKLLLEFNGPVGSKQIIDSAVGGSPKTITVHGALSDVQTKFGPSSMHSFGVAGACTISPSFDFNFGVGEFLIDFWVYAVSRAHLFSWYLNPDNFFGINWTTGSVGTRYRIRWRRAGVDVVDFQSTLVHVMFGGWHHIALARSESGASAGAFFFYHDGDQDGWSGVATEPFVPCDLSTHTLHVGAALLDGHHSGLHGIDGFLDEFRVGLDLGILDVVPPAASIGFVPRSAAFFPDSRDQGRGAFAIRDAGRADQGRSSFDMGIITRDDAGRGSFHVKQTRDDNGSGRFAIRLIPADEGKGSFGIGAGNETVPHLNGYLDAGRGAYAVRETGRADQGRGEFNVLDFIAADGGRGLWVIRAAAADAGKTAFNLRALKTDDGRGVWQLEETDDVFEVYHSIDTIPDPEVDTPFGTFTGFPITTPALTGTGVHNLLIVRRNRFGLRSLHIANMGKGDQATAAFRLVAGDVLATPIPSAPHSIVAAQTAINGGTISAVYDAPPDDPDRADEFALWIAIGDDAPPPAPDPLTAPTVTVPIGKQRGSIQLVHTWAGLPAGGAPDVLKVIVRTRLSGVASTNTDVHTLTLVVITQSDPAPRVFIARGSKSRRELVK